MTSTMTPTSPDLAEEESTAVKADDAYQGLVARLSRQSVTEGKHFDAYTDIPWDDPEMQIDPDDARWELSDDDPLGKTAWYQSQPAGIRSRIGLHLIVSNMKTGRQFEGVLKRGLLEYAARLPDGDPEFRYALHEVIEESQHSLMFQEFVVRAGLPVAGMPRRIERASRGVVKLGYRFPELFFLFVLGGEDPIDHVQRRALRSEHEIHPLLERIMRIHVTEEARHLSFARHHLKRSVPKLSYLKKARLAVSTPFILGTMAAQMLRPSKQIVRTYKIPKDVLAEAYDNREAKEQVLESLTKVRRLCTELGLMRPIPRFLWKINGLD